MDLTCEDWNQDLLTRYGKFTDNNISKIIYLCNHCTSTLEYISILSDQLNQFKNSFQSIEEKVESSHEVLVQAKQVSQQANQINQQFDHFNKQIAHVKQIEIKLQSLNQELLNIQRVSLKRYGSAHFGDKGKTV